MWDKYDYFNLVLVSNVSSTSSATYATNDNKLGNIYMNGLKWINCNYDVYSKTYTNNAVVGFVNFSSLSATVGTSVIYNNLSVCTFSKGNPNTNINIFYNKISDNLSNAVSSSTFPAMCFIFKIYGIPKKDDSYSEGSNNNNQRLF